MQNVYYLLKEFDNTKTEYELPINVLNHCKNKYGENGANISLFAYNLLFDAYFSVFNKPLNVTFLPSNKPISNDAVVSISHSNNVVAICFSNVDCGVGIDVQEIKKELSKNLKNLLNGLSNSVETDYLYWTKREAYIKANDLLMLTKRKIDFNGVSKILKFKDVNYAVSIHCNKEVNFVEVKL